MNDELLLIVDKNDNIIGEGYKKEIHRNRVFHRQVCLIIKNSKNQLLLQKRKADKIFDPNRWTSAVTGHVTYKDSYDISIIRETEEEIGFVVKVDELKKLGKMISFSEQNGQLCGGPTMIYLMQKDLNLSDLKAQESEVTDLKWMNVNELKGTIFDNSKGSELKEFADDFVMVMKYYFLK